MKSHTNVACGARSGSILSFAQTSGLPGFLLFKRGAMDPTPAAPWHATHPFVRYSSPPSLAVPFPGGSSSPVGLMEISSARISSAVGVRPTPYVAPCASSETPTSRTNANAMRATLREPIGHAPVPRDLPGLNAVVQTGDGECGIEGFVPVLGELFARRLHLTDLVRGARQDLRLVSVPVPLIAETGMGHPLWCSLELGPVPFLAAVG